MSPDSVNTRNAVSAATAAFFAREAAIGQVMPLDRLNAAISSASGLYDAVIALPASDITPAATAMPTLDTITFTSGSALPQGPA